MNESWKTDPRLKNMDPKKMSLLLSFAKELETAPKNQKMAVFLSINQRAAADHITFSDQERDLLISILTEDMPPEEKNKVRLIRNLAMNIQKNGRQ